MREVSADQKTGFILAAGTQVWAGQRGSYNEGPLDYTLRIPVWSATTNIYAGKIASTLGISDYVSTDASACGSSLKVLMEVENLMEHFGFQRVVVLSLEDAVSNASLEFFGQAKASIQYVEGEEERVSSAFDNVNSGFHIGQGAVLAVFESEDAISNDPKAQLLGAYTSAEINDNYIGQREDGQGYIRAIEGVLYQSGTEAKEISVVKTHGTGTDSNNKAERNALETTLPSFIATSFKPTIGHTVSASGLLETGLLLDSMAAGVVPKIGNRTEEDAVFLSEDAPVPRGNILSLASGMGNVFSAALFKRC